MDSSSRKYYEYKVYSSTGTYLTSWTDVISEFGYNQEINTAGSAVQVELARNSETRIQSFDTRITQASDTRITEASDTRIATTDTLFSSGESTDVALNNKVEVYVFYGRQATRITQASDTRITEAGDTRIALDGAPNGRLLYTGFVTQIDSRYGQQETTLVTLLSYGAKMDKLILENASATTVTYSSQDPTAILRNVLDKFTAAGGIPDYDSTSTTLTNTSISYTFKVNTYYEAIQKCLELAPTDWFWYLDMAQNIIYFRPKPVQTTHLFIKGRHINSLKLEQHIEALVNVVYFTGGPTAGVNLFNKYSDAPSVATWGTYARKITDNRVTSDTTAQIISQSLIDRYKNPTYRSQITISDSVYNIEDVRLGELVTFANFGNDIDTLTMQIVGISYKPDEITLQLDTLPPAVSKRVEDIKRNLNQSDSLNNPSSP